jgi:hypothetical protein
VARGDGVAGGSDRGAGGVLRHGPAAVGTSRVSRRTPLTSRAPTRYRRTPTPRSGSVAPRCRGPRAWRSIREGAGPTRAGRGLGRRAVGDLRHHVPALVPNVCGGPKASLLEYLPNEHVCGRPLGLRFDKRTGDLYIADAYFGLHHDVE